MKVELISITPNAAELIERAGRVCYNSEPGDAAKFIRARMRAGHESILEHASATFEIDGISRACSHQLVRHRLASYSQRSQRYVDADDRIVIPDSIGTNSEAQDLWNWAMASVWYAYKEFLKIGIVREDARYILPAAVATKIVVTMNFRELLHFFRMRCHKSAQWEIREMANRMRAIMAEQCPEVFEEMSDEIDPGK